MTTPTKERLAAALAGSIFEQIASPLERVEETALAPFRRPAGAADGHRRAEDGSYSFSFGVGATSRPTSTRPWSSCSSCPAELGGGRGRRTALVIDEFQEIVDIDPRLPKLMRAVFQQQPEVAHVYLGSKRHVMERIFNDANEPFWRSAKPIELGPIDPGRPSPPSSSSAFERHRPGVDPDDGRDGSRHDRRPSLRDPGALLLPLGADRRGGDGVGGAASSSPWRRAALRARPLHCCSGRSSARVQKLVHAGARAGTRASPSKSTTAIAMACRSATSVQKALRALEQREVVVGRARRLPDRPSRSWPSGCGGGD